MIRPRYLLIGTLVLMLGWFVPAAAQDTTPNAATSLHVPTAETITYQGVLTYEAAPANGAFDFQFTLYDVDTQGTALGQISIAKVLVTKGKFTAQLTFNEGILNGEQRWLEIAVKPQNGSSYTILAPRQVLTAAPVALALPGFWTRQNTVSPNLLGGYIGNTIQTTGVGMTISGGGAFENTQKIYDNYGVVGGGANNSAGSNDGSPSSDPYITISGGLGNAATRSYSVIGGGQTNTISGIGSVIGGGFNNNISAGYATIGGGGHPNSAQANRVYDHYGTIGGGTNNVAGLTGEPSTEIYATVGGGYSNTSSGVASTVAGGGINTASSEYATVGGGRNNSADHLYTTIGGGRNNLVTALYGTIGGGGGSALGNKVYDNYGTVGGGYNNVAGVTGNAEDQPFTTVAGGNGNTASSYASFVGGGNINTASGHISIVSGGNANTASGYTSFVGGGNTNTASGYASAIGGGRNNTASTNYSFIGGGNGNNAAASHTAINGGEHNNAKGDFSTILGGSGNTTLAEYALAAGENAVAAHAGSFVWAGKQTDKTDTIASTAPGQFIVRAPGGAWFGSSTNVAIPDGAILATESGAFLSKGGTWSNSSDKHLKSNFAAIDSQALLAKLATIPVLAWNYTSEGANIRHIGPTAQDFYQAFGLGSDDRHIATVDADGVALAAVQGLHSLATEQATLIDQQAEQLASLDARLAALETGSTAVPALPWGWLLGLVFGLGWLVGLRSVKGRSA